MPDRDSSAKRVFARELLAASRAGRIAWSGTAAPECYQFNAAGFVLTIRPADNAAPTLTLHHGAGHLMDVVKAAAEGEDGPSAPTLAEIYDLARHQALGLNRTWRSVTKQVVAALAAQEPTPGR